MSRRPPPFLCVAVAVLLSSASGVAAAQETAGGSDDAALAKQLANPVASLISVPLQNNWDFGYGDDDGWRYTGNIQPVIPISIAKDWNLISRTILPIIYQDDVLPDSDQSGLGDTTQSLFLSPKEPWPFGLVWGVGPVALLPTGTREVLSAQNWGAGPTAVLLKQHGPFTVGILANHIWSFAGDGDREDVSSTFLQPFVNYTTKKATSFIVNTESTYDWEADEWSIPLNAGVTQVFKIGSQRVQIGILAAGGRRRRRAGPIGACGCRSRSCSRAEDRRARPNSRRVLASRGSSCDRQLMSAPLRPSFVARRRRTT